MTEVEFEGLVRDMRDAQKSYFRSRSPEVLERAKVTERAVDEELKRRAETRKPRAKSLFDAIDEYDQPPTKRQLT